MVIHPDDTYSLDYTLAFIIAPALKQLRKDKIGVPQKVFEYCNIKIDENVTWGEEQDKQFNEALVQWQIILDKMIFAFETITADDDNEDESVNKRVEEGLELFGKFYRCLWT